MKSHARGTLEVVETRAGVLSESPVWDEKTSALYWVDIISGLVHRRSEDGARRVWKVESDVGCIVLGRDGHAIVGLRHGIHTLDLNSGEIRFLVDAERDNSKTRFNDGKADRQGRLWIGTLDDADEPTGALYRVGADCAITSVRQDVSCSNGIDWSPDGRTFYWVDSPTQTIFAFDFDPDSGVITNQRSLVVDSRGVPDGITVDAEGCIWCARWDGWCIVRYAPDGRVVTVIPTPVARPTSVAFGGRGLDELFVTSAAWRLLPEEVAKQPLAGALFVLHPGVTGFPAARFGADGRGQV